MNKEIKTYKTAHHTIEEISIGDKFVNNRGDILQFVEYRDGSNQQYPFAFILLKELPKYNLEFKSVFTTKYGYSVVTYTKKLYYYDNSTKESESYDICKKLPSIKEKIDLL